MTDKELAREIRKQRRLEKLGSNNPICGTCGEFDYRVLERHHVAGRKHDPDTVIICRNCHRKVSDDQKDHPELTLHSDQMLHAIGLFLLGMADLLKLILEKLNEFGLALVERATPAGVGVKS
ncbi:hypothetical protein EB810_14465 [Altererythrobacter sp. FM1]|uniref:hypothetical protein n=1 Tax=Tsuneonella flava TaxID=2055955 RepID=UPI000C7F8950|nr:hypothetical protein [Tsuneonella flava]ROT93299.1 hypothetical protein EB810_14465 [Altererythrobacter sp. FM1]